MAKYSNSGKRVKKVGSKKIWLSKYESLKFQPLIELFISAGISTALIFWGQIDLAIFVLVLGSGLSFNRFAFTKKLEEEMVNVNKLANIINLKRKLSNTKILDFFNAYLEITESEFDQIKDKIVTDAFEELSKIAIQKTSSELSSGTFYVMLLSSIEKANPGSKISAVSMMLDIEWNGSIEENKFINATLDAARKGVTVERIFVAPFSEKSTLYSNRGIKVHYDNRNEYLIPKIVDREHLLLTDPQLITEIGDGFIAINNHIALYDIATQSKMRGYVTMKQSRIARLHQIFDELSIHAHNLEDLIRPEA